MRDGEGVRTQRQARHFVALIRRADMADIPEEYLDLLEEEFATVATLLPDGNLHRRIGRKAILATR